MKKENTIASSLLKKEKKRRAVKHGEIRRDPTKLQVQILVIHVLKYATLK